MTTEDVKSMITKLSANRETMFSLDSMEEHMKSLQAPATESNMDGGGQYKQQSSEMGGSLQSHALDELQAVGQHQLMTPLEQHPIPTMRETARESSTRESKRPRTENPSRGF
jgi:hypothetical protein